MSDDSVHMEPTQDGTAQSLSNDVDHLIAARHSVRAFLPQSVSQGMVADILQIAARAPSGSNIQPWKVYVLMGEALRQVSHDVIRCHDQSLEPKAPSSSPSSSASHSASIPLSAPFPYYPSVWVEPYLQRRRDNGWGLYDKLGILRGEKEKMHRQHQANFSFFGAPVGLLFTLSRALERGSMLDLGMFMQNIMLAAKARGLDTCPQAAWLPFASVVMPLIGANEDQEMLMCGMCLGYADPAASVNDFVTPRESVNNFTQWLSKPGQQANSI